MNDENSTHEHKARSIASLSGNNKNDWKDLRRKGKDIVAKA